MTTIADAPSVIARLDAFVLRFPVTTPVQTSFGIMHDRPAVFVRVTDTDGAEGWGEIWCNFPAVGAEHRAALTHSVLAPLLEGREVGDPAETFQDLTERTAVLALQCAEPGPFAQAIAGVDLALWDLRARKVGQPLWRVLGGGSDEIGVYASGINPTGARELAQAKRVQGFTAFKLKVGFGVERDVENLTALREVAGPQGQIMVDANQAWDLETAVAMAARLAPLAPTWLEEPLRCDRPSAEWRELASRCAIPLAAGENVAGAQDFAALIDGGAISVVQPDIAKWGGISATLPVARRALAAGRLYCPHYLGGGIGLVASAHLLAAVGGAGKLEVDANENPLRTLLSGAIEAPEAGRVRLGEAPGIGVAPNLDDLARRIAAAA